MTLYWPRLWVNKLVQTPEVSSGTKSGWTFRGIGLTVTCFHCTRPRPFEWFLALTGALYAIVRHFTSSRQGKFLEFSLSSSLQKCLKSHPRSLLWYPSTSNDLPTNDKIDTHTYVRCKHNISKFGNFHFCGVKSGSFGKMCCFCNRLVDWGFCVGGWALHSAGKPRQKLGPAGFENPLHWKIRGQHEVAFQTPVYRSLRVSIQISIYHISTLSKTGP